MIEFSFYFPPESLRAGLLVSLLSVWLLVGVFAYLNHYTQRRYFTLWTAAWLFYGVWLALHVARETGADTPLLLMLRHWSVGVSAVFLFWGSLMFLGRKQRQVTFGLLIAFLMAWSYVAAFHLDNPLQAEIPIFVVLGMASLRAGFCFYMYRRRREYLGASLLMVGLTLWGLYLGGYPIWEKNPYWRPSCFFLCGLLQLFIAVSMIVLVLEEARSRLQHLLESNRAARETCAGLRDRVRSSEDRYHALFEQASDALFVTSTETLEVWESNRCARRLLGWDGSQSGARSLVDCVEELRKKPQPLTGPQALERLRAQRATQLVAANGSKTPVEAEVSLIEFAGRPAYQFAFREITERTRLEEQLRQSEKLTALGRMISGVAHELNNPLAVIKGYLEIILARHPMAGQTRHDLLKVAREAERASNLVGNFLTLARVRPSPQVPTQLNEVVQRVLERSRIDLRMARIETRLDLTNNLPPIQANPDKLEQVIDNLVRNAIQALSSERCGGIVRLATERFNGSIRVRVEDNGPGVPEHLASRIFEPFFTTKPAGKGTGLGLSISHGIISEHNGRLYQQPSELGGAGFVMELPLTRTVVPAEIPAAEPTPGEPAPPGPTGSPPARILILDDEPTLVEMLGQVVRHLGHETRLCSCPVEALKEIEKSDFDLILSDYRMPDLDGRQFYERVTAIKAHLRSRIIFLTGDVANEDTQNFLASTGNPCILKPFHLRAVESAINAALQKCALPA